MKPRFYYKLLFVLLVYCHAVITNAQTQVDLLGGWYYVSLNYNLNSKFFIYTELQTRSQHVANDFDYREIKGGLAYVINPHITTLLGAGNYKTFSYPGNYDKLRTNENRIWEQFVGTNNFRRLFMEHRVRIEQRWLNGDFENRFRYRLALTVPLNHPTVRAKTVYSWVFDEVFFSNKDPYFLRNRFLIGGGYRFNNVVMVQAGFIRQSNFFADKHSEGKNYILTGLIFNAADKHKKHAAASSAD